MLIFDIGCNVGSWLSANYKPENEYVCIDALPSAVKTLSENWNKPNVKIVHALISDFDDVTTSFYVSGASTGEVSTASMRWKNTSRHHKTGYYQDMIQVRSMTIDKLISEYGTPEKIKIDVEGYELFALQGLSRKIKSLSFEFAEEFKEDLLKSIDRCIEIGYTGFYLQHGDDYLFRPDIWYDADTIRGHIIKEFRPFRRQIWGMLHAQ